MYEFALFLHLLGVAGLAAGTGLEQATLHRLRHARSGREILAAVGIAQVNGRLMPAASVLLILPGLYMVSERWSWTSPWMLTAAVLLIGLNAAGGAVVGRRAAALATAAATSPDTLDPAVARMANDPVLHFVMWLDATAVVAALLLMTTKPNLVGSLLAAAAAIVVALVVSMALQRGQPAAETA
jgi:hypothetical protein